jgi:hypothetical protein
VRGSSNTTICVRLVAAKDGIASDEKFLWLMKHFSKGLGLGGGYGKGGGLGGGGLSAGCKYHGVGGGGLDDRFSKGRAGRIGRILWHSALGSIRMTVA